MAPIKYSLRRDTLKSYVLNIWQTFKLYGYRRIVAYSQLNNDFPKITEYMALKLLRELWRIRSCM
ncbi:hypothetical protein LCI01_06310 [Leuconostoc citreum]|nr:hypothetical protein LCI01_06310 [Leuconostoc citreum]